MDDPEGGDGVGDDEGRADAAVAAVLAPAGGAAPVDVPPADELVEVPPTDAPEMPPQPETSPGPGPVKPIAPPGGPPAPPHLAVVVDDDEEGPPVADPLAGDLLAVPVPTPAAGTIPGPPPVARAPAVPPPADAAVLARLDGLDTRLDELARLGTRQRELVDELHAENQRLRAGELDQAQAPLLRDLVRLHDDVERLESAAGDGGADLALVRTQLLAVLDRAGVRRYEADDGDPFDGARHHGVGTVDGGPPEAGAKVVARMVRCGFERDDGRLLRAAEVEVYRGPPAGA